MKNWFLGHSNGPYQRRGIRLVRGGRGGRDLQGPKSEKFLKQVLERKVIGLRESPSESDKML